jgi:hypothetical protein
MSRSVSLNPRQHQVLLDRYRKDRDPDVRFRAHILLFLADPAEGSAKGDAPVPSHAGQGDPFFQEGPEEVKSLVGLGSLGLREAAERRRVHRRDGSSGTPKHGEWDSSPLDELSYRRPCQKAALPHFR